MDQLQYNDHQPRMMDLKFLLADVYLQVQLLQMD